MMEFVLVLQKKIFINFLDLMNYKKKSKEKDIFFYIGDKKNRKKTQFIRKINRKDNPFQKLMGLNLK